MALFGFLGNYSKPGPGVSKDEDEDKSDWAKFFIVFFRNLSKITKLNLIFLLPLSITVILMFFLYIAPGVRISYLDYQLWEMYVMTIPLIFLNPFWGGVVVVARRIAKREYVFVWHEYWKGVASNWKQFLANGFLVYFVYVLTSFAYIYYSNSLSESWLYFIPYGLLFLFVIIFITLQYYVSLLIVSLELPLKAIYKNAFIFSVLGIVRNIIFSVLMIILGVYILFFSIYNGVIIIISLAILFLYLFSFIAYSNAYIQFPVIYKYVIAPTIETSDDKEELVFEDKTRDDLDEDSDEYLFRDI